MPKELQTFLPIIAMFAIFYFLLIRPQQKRQKEHQQLVASLQVNDPVVTAGGIMGTILKVKDNSVILKTIDNTKFEILKSHIAYRNQDASEEHEKEENK